MKKKKPGHCRKFNGEELMDLCKFNSLFNWSFVRKTLLGDYPKAHILDFV